MTASMPAERDPTQTGTLPGGRFPGFDGLRAIAALSIVLTHVAFATGANSNSAYGRYFARMDGGVAVFFVLSGFLLYRPFLTAHVLARPVPKTGTFYWRRFLRIYPAYWVVVTVVVFVFGDKAFDSFKAFFLSYSLLNVYSTKYAFGPLIQSWTLSAEVAFYFLLPIWAYLVSRRAAATPQARLRREVIGIVVLALLSAAYKAVALGADLAPGRVGQLKQLLPWWLDLFAVGMLLAAGSVAVAHLRRPTPLRLDERYAPVVCWLLAIASFALVADGIGLPYTTPSIARHLLWPQHYLYGLTATLLVLPAVFGPQDRESSIIRRFLSNRVMVYLGMVSYGIYLWHDPWIDRYLRWTDLSTFTAYTSDTPFAWHTSRYFSAPFLSCLFAVLVLTIASASLSWYGIERPILKLRSLPSRLRSGPRR